MAKKLSIMSFFMLWGSLILGAQTSESAKYVRVVFPEDKDVFTAVGDQLANYDGNPFILEFKGEVSADCVKIRVLWTSGDGKRRDDYTLAKFAAGDRTFLYRAGATLDNLAYGSNQYRIFATFKDGTVLEQNMILYIMHGHVGEKAKPVIYLYPKEPQDVFVAVRPQGGVTVSHPEMGTGWNVRAYPDGTLADLSTGKLWPYLFWESADYGEALSMTEGHVIPRLEVDSWMRNSLGILGLEPHEIRDFMTFWLPILTEKPYVFIYFHPRERIDREAPLEVKPRPDSVIRVYFEFKGLEAPVATKPQVLVPAQRHGFSLVEWGGRR